MIVLSQLIISFIFLFLAVTQLALIICLHTSSPQSIMQPAQQFSMREIFKSTHAGDVHGCILNQTAATSSVQSFHFTSFSQYMCSSHFPASPPKELGFISFFLVKTEQTLQSDYHSLWKRLDVGQQVLSHPQQAGD